MMSKDFALEIPAGFGSQKAEVEEVRIAWPQTLSGQLARRLLASDS